MDNMIMAIDDDVAILNILKDTFERESLGIRVFNDHRDAMKEAERADYDVFLIDMKLPDINGIDLLKELKKVQKNARFIMITGYGDVNSAVNAFKAGVSDFILKPFKADEIICSVRKQIIEKNKIDYHLTRWDKMLGSSGIAQFNNLFQGIDSSIIKNLGECDIDFKELSYEYNMIARKNVKALRKMAAEVKKEKKLAVDMLSYVSHEIKSPLSTIIGYTRTLLQQCEEGKTERINEFLRDILTSSLYMLDLTNNILMSSILESKKLTLELERVHITEVFENVKPLILSRLNEKKLTYSEHVEDGLPAIKADRLKLTQIIYNLLDNAIRYTTQGNISIEAKKSADKKSVLFAVSDTGSGISYNNKSKLFRRFTKIRHDRSGGTGLGLSIAKELVELHGGRIWVESRLNRGSVFFFTIPAPLKN